MMKRFNLGSQCIHLCYRTFEFKNILVNVKNEYKLLLVDHVIMMSKMFTLI